MSETEPRSSLMDVLFNHEHLKTTYNAAIDAIADPNSMGPFTTVKNALVEPVINQTTPPGQIPEVLTNFYDRATAELEKARINKDLQQEWTLLAAVRGASQIDISYLNINQQQAIKSHRPPLVGLDLLSSRLKIPSIDPDPDVSLN